MLRIYHVYLSHSARDLVQGVSTVKFLLLSADFIQALTLVQDELPILHNLTKLKIGCSKNTHFTLLRLLGSAPNLEELKSLSFRRNGTTRLLGKRMEKPRSPVCMIYGTMKVPTISNARRTLNLQPFQPLKLSLMGAHIIRKMRLTRFLWLKLWHRK